MVLGPKSKSKILNSFETIYKQACRSVTGPRKTLPESTCIIGEVIQDTKVSNMCLLQH